MKRRYIIISVITVLIVGIFSISLVVYHNKQQHMYDKMTDAFFKATKRDNKRPDEIKKYIKAPNKENSALVFTLSRIISNNIILSYVRSVLMRNHHLLLQQKDNCKVRH